MGRRLSTQCRAAQGSRRGRRPSEAQRQVFTPGRLLAMSHIGVASECPDVVHAAISQSAVSHELGCWAFDGPLGGRGGTAPGLFSAVTEAGGQGDRGPYYRHTGLRAASAPAARLRGGVSQVALARPFAGRADCGPWRPALSRSSARWIITIWVSYTKLLY